VKVRRITRGPRATFDLKPRCARRRDHRAVLHFRAKLDPEKLQRPAITLSFLLRMLRALKFQKRNERRLKDYRWFDKRYRQMKLGVRKDVIKVPKW